jgi:SSS family solute:Na+ symporter
MEWARTRPAFLRETRPQVLTITTRALREDVEAGRASAAGEMIRKQQVNPPAGIFFEKVALTDPKDPDSPRIGIGRFQAEIWVLSWFGADFSGFSKAQLNAVRFGFDALFPFLLLFLLSALTRPIPKADLDRFFAKIHTPVQPTPGDEEQTLRHAVEHYDEIERKKLWPGSSWEFMKPVRADVLGFFGSWLLVGVIIFLLWLMVNIK